MKFIYKLICVISLMIIVLGAICWGIWGLFKVEILCLILGPKGARIAYSVIGLVGVFGVHLVIDYAKKLYRF